MYQYSFFKYLSSNTGSRGSSTCTRETTASRTSDYFFDADSLLLSSQASSTYIKLALEICPRLKSVGVLFHESAPDSVTGFLNVAAFTTLSSSLASSTSSGFVFLVPQWLSPRISECLRLPETSSHFSKVLFLTCFVPPCFFLRGSSTELYKSVWLI